jgi:hypothetical protein
MTNNTARPNRLQFTLLELFVFVTVAGITFALLSAWGVDGLLERINGALVLAAPFMPLLELFYWWRPRNERTDNQP